jgi:small subunit ribosomal protein S18
MAPKDRQQQQRRRGGPTAGPIRKKNCWFCRTKVEEVDYKDLNQLRRYVSEKGKIRSRRITGACRRHQRQVAVAVKRAREMALLPYVAEGRDDREGGRRDRGDRGDRDRSE